MRRLTGFAILLAGLSLFAISTTADAHGRGGVGFRVGGGHGYGRSFGGYGYGYSGYGYSGYGYGVNAVYVATPVVTAIAVPVAVVVPTPVLVTAPSPALIAAPVVETVAAPVAVSAPVTYATPTVAATYAAPVATFAAPYATFATSYYSPGVYGGGFYGRGGVFSARHGGFRVGRRR